ncbi:hypothetical protein RUM43_003202 [Polyplax serrata]|uniref:Homeobox domain-containing protein n=1 Tax=Polyplax serrata TaxID=468196 RepID=A0AAN8NW93_POLSC
MTNIWMVSGEDVFQVLVSQQGRDHIIQNMFPIPTETSPTWVPPILISLGFSGTRSNIPLHPELNDSYLDFGRGPNTPGGLNASGRSKRMRTSFKHHQLRTMKSYFSINHNPDAKDLKQLSQKTSLPKRVLQVRET